ncbi:MAG: permease [Muribaculaceae bacterium]|nr:permease [Muribaculaceae bacterium]
MELLNSLLFMLNEMSPYILLGFMIAGLMHAFVPQHTMARHLSGRGWRPVVKAALAGIPLPLCSCGVLPTAIAMRRGGASKAATTSFLIATPQTGVDSIAATWSLLGPAFAIIRPIAALVTSFFGGLATGHDEKMEPVRNTGTLADECGDCRPRPFGTRCLEAMRYGFIDLVGSIGGWLVTGLVIAALISVYVPADFFAAVGSTPIVSMLAVLLIAIPMYVCATGSIPIAMSLVMKGLSPGTALVLLMAGPAANFASYTLISREMGHRTARIYLASIATGAIAFGLLIDYVLPAQWFTIGQSAASCHEGVEIAVFPTICSALLCTLLIYTFIKIHIHKTPKFKSMTVQYNIKGMNCPHCQAAVTKAIQSVNGVTGVNVNLSTGIAEVEGNHDSEDIRKAVMEAGFDLA